MPFPKWNLEPVHVSRTLPWAAAIAAIASCSSKYSNHEQIKSKNGQMNGTKSAQQPPPMLPCIPNIKNVDKTNLRKQNKNNFKPNVDSNNENDENMEDDCGNEESNDVNGGDDDYDCTDQSTINYKEPRESPAVLCNNDNNNENNLTDDEQLLLKIHNRTLTNIIRQISSLLLTSDQLFMELTDDCKRLFDRSIRLRQRFNNILINIDHLNHKMRHSVPTIGQISKYYEQQKEAKKENNESIILIGNVPHRLHYLNQMLHYQLPQRQQTNLDRRSNAFEWKSNKQLDHSLFTMNSRPVSIRNLYARAHAPGDVRLSCSIYSPFIIQPKTIDKQQTTDSIQKQCQCNCGHCHQKATCTNDTDNGNMKKSSRNHIHNENDSNQCEYCINDERHIGHHSASSQSSNCSSSVVTWSSVTSSTFEPITSTQHKNLAKPPVNKMKVGAMSSFSSYGDYCATTAVNNNNTDNSQRLSSTTATKTIDDFFRVNNLFEDSRRCSSPIISVPQCVCTCDKQTNIMETSHDNSSNATINHSSITMAASIAMGKLPNTATALPDYWYWCWLMQSNCNADLSGSFAHQITNNTSNTNSNANKRWSSALTPGSSPLKPTILDEMTIWIRENIECRRPESIVIKSASELPEHVLLERALSPPCSSHSISLRRHHSKLSLLDEIDDDTNKMPKLKRRWSLLPIRRLSKRWRLIANNNLNDNNANHSNHLDSEFSEISLSDNERIERQKKLIKQQSSHTECDHDDNNQSIKEVIIMSPEERFELLARQFSDSQTVTIDVSGRYFDRQSNTRKSLIHSEFHIPRNKIPVSSDYHHSIHRRSRSKSPHYTTNMRYNTINDCCNNNASMVSPYALGNCKDRTAIQQTPIQLNKTKTINKIMSIEKGCQTDNNLLMDIDHKRFKSSINNNDNQLVVPIEVHRNVDDDYGDYDDADYDNDEQYVIIKKRNARIKNNDQTIACNASSRWRQQQHQMIATENDGKPVTNSSMTTSTASTTIVAVNNNSNDDDKDSANRNITNKQNNGTRSSSGNWSAATSDLIASSQSSSASPPLKSNKNENIKYQHNQREHKQMDTSKLDENNANKSNTANSNNNSSNAEEAESVYSVDNDGYYTSMHNDSGLFLLGANYSNRQVSMKTSTFTSQTSLAKRQSQLQHKQQQRRYLNDKYRFDLNSSIANNQNRFKNLNTKAIINSNNNNIKLKSIKRIDEEDNFNVSDQKSAIKHRQQQTAANEFGSNTSINSILSNSDNITCDGDDCDDTVSTTAAFNNNCFSNDCNSSINDFDCSVSHCSHQPKHNANQSNSSQNKRQQTDKSHVNKSNNRLRTASGTYVQDNDNDSDSSSSETLHTNDYEDYANASIESHSQMLINANDNYDNHRQINTKTSAIGSYNLQHKHQKIHRYKSNLTESSSASSSCRKLPPPPPPPRVSSMLRTLQKYNTNHKHSNISANKHSSKSDGRTTHKAKSLNAKTDNGEGNELSNSDYFVSQSLIQNDEHRRRRLFFNVDTNRSYPPFSYVYDQTLSTDNTSVTSVSIPSSVCCDDEQFSKELDKQTSCNDDHFAEKHGQNTQTIDTISNRTLTPVSSIVIDSNGDDEHEQQTIRKPLEHRHLSSPLPTPKLNSFTFENDNRKANSHNNNNHDHQHNQSGLKNKSPDVTSNNQLSSASSLTSSSTIKAPSSPETIPKPKPRNSLIFSSMSSAATSVSSVMSTSTFSTSTCSSSTTTVGAGTAFSSPDSTITAINTKTNDVDDQILNAKSDEQSTIRASSPKTSPISPVSSTGEASSPSPSSTSSLKHCNRRLTTEDLFIILHNSKKRHNIKADPQLFLPSQRLSSPTNNSQSSNSPGPRSPISPTSSRDVVLNQNECPSKKDSEMIVSDSIKRRSWTSGQDITSHNNTSRTRQSLASDRLGPIRPTTLNDFKKLLSQVRPSSLQSSNANINNNTNNSVNQTSSTYSALQQVLQKTSSSSIQSPHSSASPTSSGISSSLSSPICSPMSPICSPMSPIKSNTTMTTTHGSPEKSMSNFIKKFSKSKYLSQYIYTNPSERMMAYSNNANMAANLVTNSNNLSTNTSNNKCPPIPEDDSVLTSVKFNQNQSKIDENVKTKMTPSASTASTTSGKAKNVHKCTSTWV